MNKILFSVFVFISTCSCCFGQVYFEKSASQQKNNRSLGKDIVGFNEPRYDSTTNEIRMGSLFLLKGQRLIMRPNDKEKRPYVRFRRLNDATYCPIDPNRKELGSLYDSLRGRIFYVYDVVKEDDYFTKIFLRDDKDSLYVKQFNSDTFIIEGFLKKLEQSRVGQKYARIVIAGKDTDVDFNTGELIKLYPGQIWEVDRIIINSDTGNIEAVMSNKEGQHLSEDISSFLNNFDKKYKKKEISDKLKNKFGRECWYHIMTQSIYEGMSIEALKESWGEPDHINRASYGDQWVYPRQYVYIKNGRVYGWN